ncbi:MAG: Clp protease ClpP [Armatimonadota bacterium]|nr:Clp protease ClpP [Armatimonadota bacterium]
MIDQTRRHAALRALLKNSTSAGRDANDSKASWYKIIYNEADPEDVAEIFIYDEIGYFGCSAQDFAAALTQIKAKTINVRLNSPGGSVFDGMAIYRALERHSAQVIMHVDGWAASIASVIMCAGDVINIAENAYVMIHQPWSFAMGTAEDMRAEADVLDGLQESIEGIYVDRTAGDVKEIHKWVMAETWFKGKEAVDAGFADNVIPNKKKPAPAAKFDTEFFASIYNLPSELEKALHAVAKAAAKKPRGSGDDLVDKNNEQSVAEKPFNFTEATPRESEAFLREHGATRKQATDIVVNNFKAINPRDEDAIAKEEQSARDEQTKRLADEKSRDETIKAIERLINVAAIRQAAVPK